MASLTRKSQSSRAAKRDELRRRLLEAVERLLGEGESFTELSVERMVSEAGLSRSTFYLYFEDKGDLLRAWFADINVELEAAASDLWALGPDSTRDDLRAALGRIVTVYRPHVTLMAALYDAAAYDAGVRDLVEAMMERNTAGWRRHIRSGQKAGVMAADLLPDETAGWLTWMAERGLHQLVRQATDAEVYRLIEAYTAIVWSTLYAPARR